MSKPANQRRRAAALNRAARILDVAGPDAPEALLAATLRLEARALTEQIATDAHGVAATLSSISVDVVAGTGTGIVAFRGPTFSGASRVMLAPLVDGPSDVDEGLWYVSYVVDEHEHGLGQIVVDAVDGNDEVQAALAAAVAAASVGVPPASMRRPAPRSPSTASPTVPFN